MKGSDTLIKYQYLVGQKINKWTVLELNHDRRNADAICQCECGTIKPVAIKNLVKGLSKDCGCGRKHTLRETQTKNLVGQKFGKLTVVELMPDSNKFHRRVYRCVCECGNEIIVSSICLTNYHTLSCGCLISYYNLYITQFLHAIGVKFFPEYRVKIGDGQYRFDFYLPDYNLFIEYDGIQHFETMRYFGNNEKKNQEVLEKTQYRDNLKTQYCEEHNINLLRIPYYEKENLEEIIINHLQRLSEKGSIEIDQ